MASYIKGALIKDEKVIYADPPKLSFLSVSGLFIYGLLLLPLFGIWLIVWLVLHKLKITAGRHTARPGRAAGEPRQDPRFKRL
jgi:hypothetical protein